MSSTAPETVQCHRCHSDIDVTDVITSTVICFNCNAIVAVDRERTLTGPFRPTATSVTSSPVTPATTENTKLATASPADAARATMGGFEALREGCTVGPYVIGTELGRGAMGVVLLGIDSLLERRAAIKFMAPDIARNDECRNRFIREGRLLAKLKSHPNLVSIYSGGEFQGMPYFAMEYVDGASVRDVLRQDGPFSVQRAVDVCRQAARALDFVWRELGLVHRDIKPSNLMFDASRTLVKVTDFGLAKPNDGGETGLTRSDMILGTPDYLPPEQARCERDLDCRSDIYALGATLFHLLAGQPPFFGTSVAEVVAAHLREEAPLLSNFVQTAPTQVVDVVARMLAKDRANRPTTYAEVIEVFDAVGAAS